MKKEDIIKQLKTDNSTKGRNSMGVAESFYNKFYLLNAFLIRKKINPDDLSEEALNVLLDLSDFAGEMFY